METNSSQSLSSVSKTDSEALMEHIRKNPPAVKSINEVVGLLRAISTEQRSCNDLRSCVDKVLLNMSNIRTLRDIIERLRSVSRTNGFRFEIPSSACPETRCQLVSDMFSVKIVLGTSSLPDHSPTVLDVSIKHKEDYRSCPHLANIIRAGKFLELSNHLQGLMEMYSISGNRQSKTRMFLALQSLETDIVKMSQMYRDTHADSSTLDITMQGTVGFLTPRLAGDRPHLAYYVSPYDLIDTSANNKITLTDKVPRDIGLHAEISIEQRNTPCNLPISPLITNKHPIDISGMPRFMDVSHHNSTNIQSCFVLHLKPPLPVLQKVANDICKVVGFSPVSVDGKTKNYLELLGAEKDTFKVRMGEDIHVYHLASLKMKATLVNKVNFSHPAHVCTILSHLRKQAHLNTAISSCIRKFMGSKKGREWFFEVCCDDKIDRLNITMEHPSSKGTAFLEIRLDDMGFPGCKIFTGRGDPPLCNDEIIVKVLNKCSSLPITMRKLIEQSMSNPRREPDIPRARAPTLFPPLHPTILTPVPPRFPHQTQHPYGQIASVPATSSGVVSVSGITFHPTTVDPPATSFPKKARENPMLTNLLKKETPEQEQQQRSNPMLLNLLKENMEDARTEKLDTQLGQQIAMLGNQSHMNSTTSNSFAFMSAGPTFQTMDSTLNSSSHTMPPPPSYPNTAPQNQYVPNPLATMSPAHIPHSPYSSQRSPMSTVDDVSGPVTPTNPFGIMSPGMISPGIIPGPNRGRRGSRQKSHSIESHDFPTMDTPQYESQPSVESDMDIFGMNTRPGMTPLRRTESMSPSSNVSLHQPLHALLTKTISDSSGSLNLLTRSASVNSIKSGRSITSPVPRNIKTPEAMVTLGSPMFDINAQRGSRVKSYESHAGDFFRSPMALASPGTQAVSNFGSGLEQDTDPFSFDDNKNPSKISMSESNSQSSRAARPPMFQSNSYDKDETLREYMKSKPRLLEALTSDSPVSKPDTSQFQRQQSGSGINSTFIAAPTTPVAFSTASAFDFSTNQFTTSTSVSTVSEKIHGKPSAMDKAMQSNQQIKAMEVKSEKTVKRRHSNKTDDSKPTGKKRGRPPSVKDAAGKKRKVEPVSTQDDSSSNPPIMLNIQLSSTGTPISSTLKTKSQAGQIQTQKNTTNNNGSTPNSASRNSAANSGNNASGATTVFDGTLGKYLQSQQEFQKRKEMKDKKGVGKPLVVKQSFSGQAAAVGTSVPEKLTAGSQLGKVISVPRAVTGMPAPRKRKASIIDVVDKLHSKMPEAGLGPSSSPPGSNKSAAEKDVSNNLLPKAKTPLPHQKMAHGGFVGKPVKSPADDKVAKIVGHKTPKISIPKISPNATVMQKQTGFSQSVSLKNNRQSNEVIGSNVDNTAMHQVLRHITEAAAAQSKRIPVQNAIAKPATGKAARHTPPLKPRSVTPTSTNTPINPIQRKSPSHMVRTFSDTLTRNAAIKISPGGMLNSAVRKSPLRTSTSVTGLPSRPSSASSVDGSIVPIIKPMSTSPTAAMLNASRKHSGTPTDQHFIAPSISPTPKRTTSPLTRIEDKFKGPHRPSPTPSRISTPIPSSNPQSPEGRLVLIDDPALSLLRDEQQPDFILGSKANERQSPERATLATPLSPPPLAQKASGAMMLSTKRAPTPRSHLTPPRMSPVAVGSPLSIDDDLMNEAVI